MHCMYISHATKPERSMREHNETEDNNIWIIENAQRKEKNLSANIQIYHKKNG